jgi:hypothetical protein
LKSAKDGDRICWGTVERTSPVSHMQWSFTVGPCQLGIGQCKCEALNREEERTWLRMKQSIEPCRTICFFPPAPFQRKEAAGVTKRAEYGRQLSTLLEELHAQKCLSNMLSHQKPPCPPAYPRYPRVELLHLLVASAAACPVGAWAPKPHALSL